MELRRAVAMTLDRETIVEKLALGYATPGKSLFSPFDPQWLSPKGEPTFDPVQAQTLARSALGGERVSATLIFRSATGQARPYKAIGALIQSELGKPGDRPGIVVFGEGRGARGADQRELESQICSARMGQR